MWRQGIGDADRDADGEMMHLQLREPMRQISLRDFVRMAPIPNREDLIDLEVRGE